MADSTAVPLTTGIEPGSPRQVGQVCVFGSPPKVAGQPQNILVAVFSSTCTSSPIAGSYAASASSYDISSVVWVDLIGPPPCPASCRAGRAPASVRPTAAPATPRQPHR